MTLIAIAFLVLSTVGLGLSVISHVCSLMGIAGPLGDGAWFLHIGIFVVWLPAVIAVKQLAKNVPQNMWWRAALGGCPAWMRYATYGLVGYAMVNFLVVFHGVDKSQGSGQMTPDMVRGFSGHWMMFYGAAFAILYSYVQVGSREPARQCAAGHEVGPLGKFCEQCGQPVLAEDNFGRD